jgi:hypothetical protein
VAGYEDLAGFYQRMSQKLAWAPGMMMGGRSDIGKGFADLHKEASKLNGVPLLQVVTMRPKMDPETEKQLAEAMAQQQASGAPQSQPEGPSARQAAGDATADAAASAAGGRLGRFGGLGGGLGRFGRKKKQQEEQPPQQQPAAPAPAQAAPSSAPGALIEMTIESSNFSNTSVDASKFEVPAGFKQVESQMLKGSR